MKKLLFADRFATSVNVPILPPNTYLSSYETVITTHLNSNSIYLFAKSPLSLTDSQEKFE